MGKYDSMDIIVFTGGDIYETRSARLRASQASRADY